MLSVVKVRVKFLGKLAFSFKRLRLGRLIVIACLLSLLFNFLRYQQAQAAGPSIISFQGKVTNADGTNVTNGSYNFDFVMYDDASLGSPSDGVHDKWHELTKSVTVTNGVFQTNLGSATALPDFNTNNALYLAIRFNADAAGYMTPRVQMASVPYALNADKLNGIAASTFVQLGGTQSGNINIGSGTITAGASTLSGNTSLGTVGSGTASSTIHIADTTDLTGTQLVTIGSTAKSTDIVTIQGGGAASTIVLQTAASGGIDIGVNNVSGKTINIGSVGGTAQNSTLHFADSTAAVQTVSIGGTNTTSSTTIQAGTTGAINLSPAAGGDVAFTQAAGSQLIISASAATAIDQLAITNASGATSTTGVNGLSINFNTTGTTNSADNAGLKIDVTSGNNGTTTTLEGLKIGDLASAEANSAESGVYVGTGWDIGLDLESGGVLLAAQADPATPPDPGKLNVYAKLISGRTMLKGMGSSGVDYPYQPALFAQAISYQTPLTGATVASNGQTWTVDTTASTPAATEVFGLSTNFATAATANDTTGVSENIVGHYRGSVTNGTNGFFYVARMALPDANYGTGATGARIWFGLSNQTTATMTGNDNPAGHYVGFQYSTNRGDTTWKFMTKDGTTQTTATTTGITFAQNKVYDLYLYVAPLGTTMYWRVTNITDGQTVEGNTTATLPGASTAMRAGGGLQTLTTTARNIRVLKQYVESDR